MNAWFVFTAYQCVYYVKPAICSDCNVFEEIKDFCSDPSLTN